MIVEYLTAFAAGGMFLLFGNMTGLFIFAVGSVNATFVYSVVSLQVLPELVGDYLISYVENWLGFDKIVEKYLDPATGTDQTSSHSADKIGNVTKSARLKVAFSYIVASFILLVSLKNQVALIDGGAAEEE